MTPERKERILDTLNKRQPDITIVLENVHDPHNIAAVMRTCDSVGIQDLYVLNTHIGLHEKFGKKASSGAAKWLTIHQFTDTDACFHQIKKQHQKIYATHLGEMSSSLYDMDLTGSFALVFGNEHAGVSEDVLKYCDGNFIIPQMGMIKSLNISVACAVSLYEALRQRLDKGRYDGVAGLSPERYQQLWSEWEYRDLME